MQQATVHYNVEALMDLNCKCKVIQKQRAAEETRQKQARNVGWFLLLQKGKQL